MNRVKLGDFIEQYGDGIHGTPNYDDNGTYYFVNGNNLINGKIQITDETLKVIEEEYEKIKRPLSDNTLLLSINGTLGRVAVYNGEKIALGKSACYLNVKNDKNKYFVKGVLNTQEFQKYIQLVAHGSTIKNLAPSQVVEYEFNAPDEKVQEKIASLLKLIDDKIDNNNEINTQLEAMAKTLYDYWFLQFDFPDEKGKPYKSSGGKMVWNEELKREIPDGWETGVFADFFDIGNGKDHKNLQDGVVPVYGSGGIMRYVDKELYHGESVLIPRKGTLNNIIYIKDHFWTVDTMYYTKMKKENAAIFMYYTVKQYDFEKMNTGTGVPSMTASIIYNLKTVIPKLDILKQFDNKVQSIYNMIRQNQKQNKELASLRDFVLPLLMNGQVGFKEH